MQKEKIFDPIIESMECEDIKVLARMMIANIPDYFYEVSASSSGKHHPAYTMGEMGLAKHTIALCRILNHILSLEQSKKEFSERERDLLRLAGIMHDTRKHGEADNKQEHTVFSHPVLAGKEILRYKGAVPTVTDAEIAHCSFLVACHMGEWNTSQYEEGELLKPYNNGTKLLHLCDYLASRKDIEVKFD